MARLTAMPRFEISMDRSGCRSLCVMQCLYLGNKPVRAGAEKFQKIEIAKNLQLLADFGADVVIMGVETREPALGGINIGEGEVLFL